MSCNGLPCLSAHIIVCRCVHFWPALFCRDLSLLHQAGVGNAPKFTGLQKEIVDSNAIPMNLLDEARREFFKICQSTMTYREWNCSRTTTQATRPTDPPTPYFGKLIDLRKSLCNYPRMLCCNFRNTLTQSL